MWMFVSPTLRPRVHLQKLPKSIRYHSWEKQPTKIYHYRVGPTRFVVSRWLLTTSNSGLLGTWYMLWLSQNQTLQKFLLRLLLDSHTTVITSPPTKTRTTNSHDTLTLLVHSETLYNNHIIISAACRSSPPPLSVLNSPTNQSSINWVTCRAPARFYPIRYRRWTIWELAALAQ